ncbi:PEP-CTERM sorting domain-containing protein [Nostoc sp. 106C]|uniref:PEP-CTERM sorting domain-containing protein n=1 Tax=Nostoc sp. 106C TaxID=1932667 RepID=UPI000A3C1B0C|nr:PEP-CTERM sorting domain-containing protein [Nostoc sp. 106C]OUL22968.1 hypothetical protein BV378_23995 [Nostoc sp. RF31YmG]OUL33941.1 hypothetical protein BV375_06045 [Nostoc sp. 106C]
MKLARKLSFATVGAIIGFAGVVTSFVAPASAFTVNTTAGQFSTQPGTKTVNFDSGVAPTTGYASYSGTGGTTVISGSAPSQYSAPAGDTTPYLTIAPVGSGVAGSNSPITIALSKAADYFGLYWGSIDAYNTVEFFKDAVSLGSFTGATIPGVTANGSQSTYVNFFSGAGQEFNKIVLRTSGIAFESDNHAFKEVPEPLTIGGTALALGFGWMMKRKKALAS